METIDAVIMFENINNQMFWIKVAVLIVLATSAKAMQPPTPAADQLIAMGVGMEYVDPSLIMSRFMITFEGDTIAVAGSAFIAALRAFQPTLNLPAGSTFSVSNLTVTPLFTFVSRVMQVTGVRITVNLAVRTSLTGTDMTAHATIVDLIVAYAALKIMYKDTQVTSQFADTKLASARTKAFNKAKLIGADLIATFGALDPKPAYIMSCEREYMQRSVNTPMDDYHMMPMKKDKTQMLVDSFGPFFTYSCVYVAFKIR